MKSNLFNALFGVSHTKTRKGVSKDRRDCGDKLAKSPISHGTVSVWRASTETLWAAVPYSLQD